MNEEHHERRGTLGPLGVAVIGLGTIGRTIARHLLDSGVTLTVFDTRPEVSGEFEARGARLAASCADAGRSVDVVIEAVGDDSQVLSMVTAPDGVLTTLRPGTVLVLHSTVRLSTVRRVAAAAADRQVHVLDAGVSTLDSHETGVPAALVGAEAQDLDLMRPALSVYTKCVDNLSRLGSGITAELLRNLLGYLSLAAAYESSALAEAVGIDLTAVEDTCLIAAAVGLGDAEARDPRRLARRFLLLPPEMRSADD